VTPTGVGGCLPSKLWELWRAAYILVHVQMCYQCSYRLPDMRLSSVCTCPPGCKPRCLCVTRDIADMPTQSLSSGELGMVAPRLEQRALSLRQRERVRALLRDPRTPPGQRAAVRAIAAHHIAWQFAFEAALNAHVAGARLALRADRMRPNRRWRLPPALGLQKR
jgi:hypothetical protein